MGNMIGKREDLVDGGYPFPTGTVYSKIDCDLRIVSRFITDLKVSPFYKGLPDAVDASFIECPICFLYYPPNMNLTRCCNQMICSECFVQIRQPKTGGPATCPFCVQSEFGITYSPPRPVNGAQKVEKKEKSKFVPLPHDSPAVVTIDAIRPNGRHYPPPKEPEPTRVRRMTVSGRPASSRAARRSMAPVSSSFTRESSVPTGNQSLRIQTPSPSRYNARDMESELEHLMLLEAIHLSLMEQERQQKQQGPVAANSRGLRHRERSASDGQPSAPIRLRHDSFTVDEDFGVGTSLDQPSPLHHQNNEGDTSSDEDPEDQDFPDPELDPRRAQDFFDT